MKERKEADAGLHIEKFLAAGDGEGRKGGRGQTEIEGGGLEGKIRRSETARLKH